MRAARIAPDAPHSSARPPVLDARLLRGVPHAPPGLAQGVAHERGDVLEGDPRLLERRRDDHGVGVGKSLRVQVHPRLRRRFRGVGIASFLETSPRRRTVDSVDDVLDRLDASLGCPQKLDMQPVELAKALNEEAAATISSLFGLAARRGASSREAPWADREPPYGLPSGELDPPIGINKQSKPW